MTRRIFLLAVLAFLSRGSGVQAQDCAAVVRDVPVSSKSASASAFLNLRAADGSVRAEFQKMLGDLVAKSDGAQAPQDLCPGPCVAPAKPQIVLTSVPEKFLSDYSDEKHCADMLAKTRGEPLRYAGLQFSDTDKLGSWFGDFSQGRGKEGKDLYSRCDGSCSPQYAVEVTPQDGGFATAADVLCGPARDKDANTYRLTGIFRWRCLPARQ